MFFLLQMLSCHRFYSYRYFIVCVSFFLFMCLLFDFFMVYVQHLNMFIIFISFHSFRAIASFTLAHCCWHVVDSHVNCTPTKTGTKLKKNMVVKEPKKNTRFSKREHAAPNFAWNEHWFHLFIPFSLSLSLSCPFFHFSFIFFLFLSISNLTTCNTHSFYYKFFMNKIWKYQNKNPGIILIIRTSHENISENKAANQKETKMHSKKKTQKLQSHSVPFLSYSSLRSLCFCVRVSLFMFKI